MPKGSSQRVLPQEATCVGGPQDGQTIKRATNRFSKYRTDDSKPMATHASRRAWVEPLARYRLPLHGYQLEMVPGRVLPLALYVHSSAYYEWMLDQAADDGDDVREVLAKRPDLDYRELDISSFLLADFIQPAGDITEAAAVRLQELAVQLAERSETDADAS